MSWHPSRASNRALDPSRPSVYRAAVVQGSAGRSMLVQTDDGDDRLVPAPPTPLPTLVGSTVLVAGGDHWLSAVTPTDPVEAVRVAGHIDLREDRPALAQVPPDRSEHPRGDRFDRRIARQLRRHGVTPPS
ncbi:MAG: hypothetical protein ACXIVQ_16705 [Acidimicrobiales bacterium]